MTFCAAQNKVVGGRPEHALGRAASTARGAGHDTGAKSCVCDVHPIALMGRRWPVAREYHPGHDPFMRVVATSNNLIRLSFLTALLADAGIEAVLLDGHTSVLEGSAGAIPRRLVVGTDDFPRACRILRDAGEC